MLRRDSPLHIDVRALPHLAPWLWQFWRHCNARDYAHGLNALAALNEQTMVAYDAWAADGISFEMHRAGMLWAFVDERRVRSATQDFAALARVGYRVPEPLSGAALREHEPHLSDRIRGGFIVDEERHVRPESLIRGLTQRLSQLGVAIRTGLAVDGGRTEARRLQCLHTEHGDIQADAFIIAAGAWSGQLARRLGSKIPVEAGKGYSITIPQSALLFRRSLYFAEIKAAISPFDGHLRIAGTMELSGVNTKMKAPRVAALQRSTERYFRMRPQWEEGVAWVGARPITPDGLPLIGRLPGYENVFVATGHGMLGLTLAPVTAEVVADFMDGRQNGQARNPFDPAR